MKGFALGLVLKQRLAASWKWPIEFTNQILRTVYSYVIIRNNLRYYIYSYPLLNCSTCLMKVAKQFPPYNFTLIRRSQCILFL